MKGSSQRFRWRSGSRPVGDSVRPVSVVGVNGRSQPRTTVAGRTQGFTRRRTRRRGRDHDRSSVVSTPRLGEGRRSLGTLVWTLIGRPRSALECLCLFFFSVFHPLNDSTTGTPLLRVPQVHSSTSNRPVSPQFHPPFHFGILRSELGHQLCLGSQRGKNKKTLTPFEVSRLDRGRC